MLFVAVNSTEQQALLLAYAFRQGCIQARTALAKRVQHSSGGKVKLLGISKHGDPALRTLLITGVRSAVQTAHLRSDPTSQWLTRLRERSGWQIACVALVNKNLRIAWAMLTRGTPFDPQHRPAAPVRSAAAQPQPVALPALRAAERRYPPSPPNRFKAARPAQ
jgi:hypothetical protein